MKEERRKIRGNEKTEKRKGFFSADKRGLTQIWSGRKKIKSLPVWEN